jgi:hypothetical protein
MKPLLLFSLLLVALSVAGAQEKDAGLMTYEEYSKTRHSSPYVVELAIGKGAAHSTRTTRRARKLPKSKSSGANSGRQSPSTKAATRLF